jgi:glycosyltransferase involved in cell wall biosynthesis
VLLVILRFLGGPFLIEQVCLPADYQGKDQMLIGQGLVHDRFIEYSLNAGVLFISDDLNVDSTPDEIGEENWRLEQLLKENKDKHVVYVSSTRIQDPLEQASPYVVFRKQAESRISESSSFLIVRLPQVMGSSTSKKTLVDFFIKKILNGDPLPVFQGAVRYIIDVDDVFFALHAIIKDRRIVNKTISLAHPTPLSISEMIPLIENFLSKKALLVPSSNKSGHYDLGDSLIPLPHPSPRIKNTAYLQKILRKHYSHYLGKKWMISVVVPTYFEEKGIDAFYERTKALLTLVNTSYSHEIIFVNDGSTDGTLSQLLSFVNRDPCVRVVDFSRNFGNQAAITAGIERASGDVVVIIDDDLQDPPEVILNFLAHWHEGYKVVYGVREKRKGVGPVFKVIAKLYYRTLDALSEVRIPIDTGDFRLIDRRVVNVLVRMGEENRYFRGMVAWVGFPQVGWEYTRDKRYAGETTFTLRKYIRFALAGFIGFSEKPLYLVSYAGFLAMLIAFGLIGYVFITKLIDPNFSIRGWPSLAAMISFFSGVQLLCTGIVGLYVGKIYRQSKGRPLYLARNEFGFVLEKTSDS